MEKAVIYFFILLLLIGGVIAVGSSTGFNNEVKSPRETGKVQDDRLEKTDVKDNDLGLSDVKDISNIDCENSEIRRDRIKCRLEYIKNNKDYKNFNVLPEACRKIKDENKCLRLYEKSQSCYEKTGREKNKCFKKVIGFARAKLKDENPADRNNKAREYIVLLLYDVQEKIEDAIENNKIDVYKGAEIVDKIVEIKQMILNGDSKNDIKPSMIELREMIKNIKFSLGEG